MLDISSGQTATADDPTFAGELGSSSPYHAVLAITGLSSVRWRFDGPAKHTEPPSTRKRAGPFVRPNFVTVAPDPLPTWPALGRRAIYPHTGDPAATFNLIHFGTIESDRSGQVHPEGFTLNNG